MARRMSRKRVRWNLEGFQDIRYLPGVERQVATKVWQARRDAEASVPGGYDSGTEDGGDRVRGYVVTTGVPSIQAEAADHVLQRALAALKEGSQDPGSELVEYVTLKGKVRRVTKAQADAWMRSRSVHDSTGR